MKYIERLLETSCQVRTIRVNDTKTEVKQIFEIHDYADMPSGDPDHSKVALINIDVDLLNTTIAVFQVIGGDSFQMVELIELNTFERRNGGSFGGVIKKASPLLAKYKKVVCFTKLVCIPTITEKKSPERKTMLEFVKEQFAENGIDVKFFDYS